MCLSNVCPMDEGGIGICGKFDHFSCSGDNNWFIVDLLKYFTRDAINTLESEFEWGFLGLFCHTGDYDWNIIIRVRTFNRECRLWSGDYHKTWLSQGGDFNPIEKWFKVLHFHPMPYSPSSQKCMGQNIDRHKWLFLT